MSKIALGKMRQQMNPVQTSVWRGLMPLILVTLAALSWAFVPVYFIKFHAFTLSQAVYATVLINLSKGLLAFVVMIVVDFGNFSNRIAQVKAAMTTKRSLIFMLMDGFFMAVSNLLFLLAIAQGNGATVVLLINSWPVFASFMLLRMVPRFHQVTGIRLSGAFLAVLGLVVIVVGSQGGSNPGLALIFAFLGALGQGLTVVSHQLFLNSTGSDLRAQPTWQSIRSLVAAVFAAVAMAVMYIFGSFSLNAVSMPELTDLAMAGFFWAASGILFHMGVAKTDNAFATVPWLLAPLMSALLVANQTGEPVPTSVVVGGVIVLAANALLGLTIEPLMNVAILMMVATICAIAIFTINGRNQDEYYTIVQTLGSFFAISYGFTATRLHAQRNAMRLLEIKWRTYRRAEVHNLTLPLGMRTSAPSLAESVSFLADRASISFMKKNMFPISEVLMVTILGMGTCIACVIFRPNNSTADLVCFLITSAVMFAVVLLWAGFVDNEDSLGGAPVNEPGPRSPGEAIFGYISGFVAYAAIIAAALTGPTGWPKL
ncbi:hypothetical protein ACFWUP_12020 [Nocardia sp. NPDC058658]|uniref:hypothetical protein n=1 Tax=Nocardia sp. NPDC058658 TaxID=3346580 RepID=UPI0036638836